MRKIEELFPEDVVVIGVHSGKYIAERETPRIREASLRYGIAHPIVNDRQFRIWRSYAVRAWPTLVVIDRNGYVVGSHAGEFTVEMLEPVLDALVAVSAERGVTPPAHHHAEPPAIDPGFLRYPGKVTVDGSRMAISDTGNHRVIIGELENDRRLRISRIVTAVETRNESSPGQKLQAPQGLAFAHDKLFFTDAESHTVNVVELANGRSTVLAGTGSQMRSRADRNSGALSSPWDLVVVGDTIYVAMAGVHQLWAVDSKTGDARAYCGTGGEDIADGTLADALLAQPMGITAGDGRLYFADAESSAIRWADIGNTGSVGTIIGTGLFDFGDADGVGDKVRMQHQQGVALRGSAILVADSYNDCLKWVDIDTREARTWIRGFHEPAGVAIADGQAYIADTNAHRVMVADLRTAELTPLEILS